MISANGLLGGSRLGHFLSGTIQQFDKGHRRIVAVAETHLENAQVAAVTCGVARAEHIEQLADDVAIARAIERQATIGQAGLFAF